MQKHFWENSVKLDPGSNSTKQTVPIRRPSYHLAGEVLFNGEPLVARWQYWSRMIAATFCLEKNFAHQSKKQTTFDLGPAQPPSGEGSQLE